MKNNHNATDLRKDKAAVLHKEAEKYMQLAYVAEFNKEHEKSIELYTQAYENELGAYNAVKHLALQFEPTVSILCRSAASLAKKIGKQVECIELLSRGMEEAVEPIMTEMVEILHSMDVNKILTESYKKEK